jgi:hypothetical protein
MENLVIPALNVAVTMGLIEVVKRTELVSNRFLPLIALVIGVGTFYIGTSTSVLMGIATGLSAVGLFSGVKAASGN